MKINFDVSDPISGEASIAIDASQQEVFEFIADNFWVNYPKWAPDVIDLQPLGEPKVYKGAKGKQVRKDNDSVVESTFEITEYDRHSTFVFQGADPAYKNTYISEAQDDKNKTQLTFKFDLLEIDLFMRPFSKLIRVAIEEGAEATVEKIQDLLTSTETNLA